MSKIIDWFKKNKNSIALIVFSLVMFGFIINNGIKNRQISKLQKALIECKSENKIEEKSIEEIFIYERGAENEKE